MLETQHAQITKRVHAWKQHFNAAVARRGNITPNPHPEQLSYIDILKQSSAVLSPAWLDQTISRGLTDIGGFTPNEERILHTTEYNEAIRMASVILDSYRVLDFFKQADIDGPVIAGPQTNLSAPRLGIIFHTFGNPTITPVRSDGFGELHHEISPHIRALEIFYESNTEAVLQLPDTFALMNNDLVTIKAIKSLEDNSRLKTQIIALGLS